MIFIDGVGIGKEDYHFNPFFKYRFKLFYQLFDKPPTIDNPFLSVDNYYCFPTDARLGVEGLPLSGTGQTSIFCGVNAPKLIGKHFGPYPYSTLIPVIKNKNIFKYYIKKNEKVFFANSYPKVFFDYINSGKKRLSVTSLSCILSNMKLNKATDVWTGRSLTAEITNKRWNEKLGYKLPIIKPATAARRLLRIAAKNKFTLYEYFLTDHIGHGRNVGDTGEVISQLDEFLFTCFTEFDSNNITILLCSDHGNFEDLSIKTHTLNPALTIAAGYKAKELSETIKDISQIKPAITKLCR